MARTQAREPVEVAIVGSGIGGWGAAIRLKQEGIDRSWVVERAPVVLPSRAARDALCTMGRRWTALTQRQEVQRWA